MMRVVLIGFGAINRYVAETLYRKSLDVEIAAIGLRPNSGEVEGLGHVRVITDPEDLAEIRPDMVIEAASSEAVSIWGAAALTYSTTFVVSSASALVDDDVRHHLERMASVNGSRLIISSGAIAGIDALAAASFVHVEELHHTITKPTSAWRNTPAQPLLIGLPYEDPVVFYQGTAREAATRFPANANVVVVSALSCGVGLDAANVTLVADPTSTENHHTIQASGDFGRVHIDLHNKSLATNPKSSQLAALALLRLVRAQMPGVQF